MLCVSYMWVCGVFGACVYGEFGVCFCCVLCVFVCLSVGEYECVVCLCEDCM